MNRKKLIIIISVVTLLMIAVAALFYYFSIRNVPIAERGAIGRFFPVPAGQVAPPPPVTLPETMAPAPEIQYALTQLTEQAVAGMKAMPGGRVRYVEKATGHIYEADANGQNSVRLSNTTIPKIFGAIWSPKGDKVILSFLQDGAVKNFSAILSETGISGIFLPEGTTIGPYSPVQDRILYAVQTANKTSLISANPDNSGQVKILSLPQVDFLMGWHATNTISLLTKPSGEAAGYLYKVNLSKPALEKVTGNIKGLDVLWSSEWDKILISSAGKSMASRVASTTGETLAEAEKTLAQKCAWSNTEKDVLYCAIPTAIPPGTYPDDWFKGKAAFKDYILKINPLTGEKALVMPRSEFDVREMAVDENDQSLYFINKNDGTLWSIKLGASD